MKLTISSDKDPSFRLPLGGDTFRLHPWPCLYGGEESQDRCRRSDERRLFGYWREAGLRARRYSGWQRRDRDYYLMDANLKLISIYLTSSHVVLGPCILIFYWNHSRFCGSEHLA